MTFRLKFKRRNDKSFRTAKDSFGGFLDFETKKDAERLARTKPSGTKTKIIRGKPK